VPATTLPAQAEAEDELQDGTGHTVWCRALREHPGSIGVVV
jgi:hypothetical protein